MFGRFGLRPRNTSSFDHCYIRIVLTRSDSVFLFSFEVLDRRFIQLQLVIITFIVAKCMYVGGNGRNGLILIDADQVLQYFWLGGNACADGLWPCLECLDVTK